MPTGKIWRTALNRFPRVFISGPPFGCRSVAGRRDATGAAAPLPRLPASRDESAVYRSRQNRLHPCRQLKLKNYDDCVFARHFVKHNVIQYKNILVGCFLTAQNRFEFFNIIYKQPAPKKAPVEITLHTCVSGVI